MTARHLGTAFLLIGLVVSGAACSNSSAPTAITVTAIAVSGTTPPRGGTSQFTATATMSDSTTQNVTSLASWQSSNTAFATVSASGVVTGVATGTAIIQATYQSVVGSETITIGS